MAAQTVLPRIDVAIGASLMFFGQQLFGAVFTTLGQNVLNNELVDRLAGIAGINPQLIQGSGVTELLQHVPDQSYAAAPDAYNNSLRVCFRVGLIMTCLSAPAALAMERRSVEKKPQPSKDASGARAAEEGKQGDARD